MGSATATGVPRRSSSCDLLIRELTSADRAAVQFVFRRLGERSRLQRYLFAKRELCERDLEYVERLDHWHEEALIACSPLPRAPIGIARYVRQADFAAAEIAVEVVDDWQRCGVGSALGLALRKRAMHAGICRFVATVGPENAGARALASRLGCLRGGLAGGGSQALVIELGAAGAHVGRAPLSG